MNDSSYLIGNVNSMHSVRSHRDEVFFRVGTSALGLFVGFVGGLLLFAPLALADLLSTPLHVLLFAGAIAGGVCGAAVPGLAVVAFEGIVHVVGGVLAVLFGGDLPSARDAPGWLAAAIRVGAIYAAGVWVCLAAHSLLSGHPL